MVIWKFESSQVSQAVRRPEKVPLIVAEGPPTAGFYTFTASLQTPISGIPRAKSTIVSGGHSENSRFWEIADFSYAKTHALRRLRYRLPTQNNRENNCRIRENFAQKQGCFRSLGGGRASSHRLQSPPQKWGSMFPSYRSVSVGGSFRRCRRAVSTPDRHGNFSAPI
jgi:hypothetical protein